jgi:hypothetical protein
VFEYVCTLTTLKPCLGARIVGLGAEVLERHGERQIVAERVPAQVALLHELLHVLGRRTAGAGLVPDREEEDSGEAEEWRVKVEVKRMGMGR